ncbi:MAG: ATP-binding cassette domain-containing protein [Kineosporiaceae bacterium]|nr:ATP-binding cassette domain-containing protein [Aeromicrobium sp.]
MIQTRSLSKQFGAVHAVDGIDLDVREGDVYGFLGANGSGKTTTVRMLLGLVLATSGDIELLGESMPSSGRSVLPQVGALVEGPAASPHLSGRANLATFDSAGARSRRRGRDARITEVLEQVGLDASDRRPVRTYSLGMHQRLGLALALLRRPRLLVLDEPTNGLDPQGIREIRKLLLDLNASGTTIFLSSHLLAEIEKMCTRVGVLDRGRLVLQEQLDTLQVPTGRVVVHTPDGALAAEILGRLVESVDDGRLIVEGNDAVEVNALLVGRGVRVSEIGPLRISLEDVVLQATESS